LAITGMKRAVDLGLEDKTVTRIKETLASIYFAQDQKEESAGLYQELLAKNPTNMTALVASAHLMAGKGDFKEAEKFLNRAEQAGLARERLSLEWATLCLMAGKTDRARILLGELLDINPDNIRAWTLLGEVFLVQNESKGLEECLAHLNKAKQLDFPALVLKGHIALRHHKLIDAQTAFAEALKRSPNNVLVLEKSIQIDALMGCADLVEQHVRQLLTIDPDNAKGNYFLATLQSQRRQVVLAEDSLRKSLKKERSVLALNDLAWMLQGRREYDEAERLVREALALMPELPPAWDTLGVVLMRKGQFEEAEKALNKAIRLDPTIRPNSVHLAELYCLTKKYERANRIIDDLLSRPNEIAVADRDTLERLKKEAVENTE
jgi:Tfp pilus assembly protein PilF